MYTTHSSISMRSVAPVSPACSDRTVAYPMQVAL